MAVIEFVDRDVDAKGQDSGPVQERADTPKPARVTCASDRIRKGRSSGRPFRLRPRLLRVSLVHCSTDSPARRICRSASQAPSLRSSRSSSGIAHARRDLRVAAQRLPGRLSALFGASPAELSRSRSASRAAGPALVRARRASGRRRRSSMSTRPRVEKRPQNRVMDDPFFRRFFGEEARPCRASAVAELARLGRDRRSRPASSSPTTTSSRA